MTDLSTELESAARETEARLGELTEALESEDREQVVESLRSMHPAEIALWLESLPARQRLEAWAMVPEDLQAQLLAELEDQVRSQLLVVLEPDDVAELAGELDADDAVDMLQDLPEDRVAEVLAALEAQDRERLAHVLVYPEDTAGGLMNLDAISVRADVTLEVVYRYLRRRGEIPPGTNRLMVVDRDGRFVGTLRIADLLTHDPDEVVADLVQDDIVPIPADLPAHEVARIFEQRNYISAPVVDDEGHLLGRITVDDIIDVIRDEGERSMMQMAGLDEEEDVFAPVVRTARRRLVWLGINLVTALLAAWVIGLFEESIQKVVALAVLMPVVASMGGIAGTQTLTVTIRAMAVGQVGLHNLPELFTKELLTGLINGVVWSAIIGVVAGLWFGSPVLGGVVGVALVVNLVAAAATGATLPFALRAFGIDPALAGGVVLTTVTDVVGYGGILAIGTLVLLD